MSQTLRASLVLVAFCFSAALSNAQSTKGCKRVSIFIQHPCGIGELGHAGISINEEYYDFGPYIRENADNTRTEAKKMALYTISAKGGSFYDKVYVRGSRVSANADDIRFHLATQQSCEAYEFRATVTNQEAFLLKHYWDYIYSQFPRFHVLGAQCSSVVIRSLQYAKLLSKAPVVKSPRGLQRVLESEKGYMTSTCGEQENEALEKTKLHD